MIALFLLAVLAGGAMGFAIQRGGTCTVAAVEEVLSQRRAHRLAAMLEASLWVTGGLAIAQLLHVAGSMPGGTRTQFTSYRLIIMRSCLRPSFWSSRNF